MEHLAVHRLKHPADMFRSGRFLPALFAAIADVSDNRMPHIGAMDTNLVSSPRSYPDIKEGGGIQLLSYTPLCFCRSPSRAYGRHLLSVDGVPAHGRLDDAGRILDPPIDQGQVLLPDLSVFECLFQVIMGQRRFSNDQGAGGILIKTMNDTRAGGISDPADAGVVVNQGVDQGSVAVACRGMDDDPGRLVQDDDLIVFKEDVKRDRFRFYERWSVRIRQGGKYPPHRIVRSEKIGCLCGRAVDLDPIFPD